MTDNAAALRQPSDSASQISDNIGDVLASIRRLIAQDEAAPRREPAVRAEPRRPGASAVQADPAALSDGGTRIASSDEAGNTGVTEAGDPAARVAFAARRAQAPRADATQPLMLRRDALIPPAGPPPLPEGRLRLSAALAVVDRGAAKVEADVEAGAGRAPDAGPPTARPRLARVDDRDNSILETTPQRAEGRPAAPPPVQTALPTAVPSAAAAAGSPVGAAQVSREGAPVFSAAPPVMTPVTRSPSLAASTAEPTVAQELAARDGAATRPLDGAGDSTALHLFAPADEDIPNGAILRSLLREAIRQELQGEMGGRFSRNLRHVIRQEVARAVSDAMAGRSA